MSTSFRRTFLSGQHIENFPLAGAFLVEGGSVNVEDNRAEDTFGGMALFIRA